MPPEPNSPHYYPCPSCKASLLFEPKEGKLVCPYCGRAETIPDHPDLVVENSFEEYLTHDPKDLKPLSDGAQNISCTGCGSVVTLIPPETASECPFCGTPIVNQPVSASPIVAPQGVLPFLKTSAEANGAIKAWIGSRWFAPNALKTIAKQEKTQGVYLPFWTYDTHTTTHYVGERGEYYYETERYTETDSNGNTVTKTREVRHTRWYPTSGSVSRFFDDVLVPATSSLSEERLLELEPWDLQRLSGFDPAYLSGFKAQSYQIDIAAGFTEAQGLMEPTIINDIERDIGGDEQRIFDKKISYAAITFKHILLPVYVSAYRFNGKVYQVLVNARTGEVKGDRPYSAWKIAFFVVAIVAVIAIIYFVKHGQ